MVKEFRYTTDYERFIHNGLEQSALFLLEQAKQKLASEDQAGTSSLIKGALVFCAFSLEAKVNFVGWKLFSDAWPERASLKEKINLLNHELKTNLNWGARPLQTFIRLKKLRDTLAHGKVDVGTNEVISEIEPSLFDDLKLNYESEINIGFADQCLEDEEQFWRLLLKAARIEPWETITKASGGSQLLE